MEKANSNVPPKFKFTWSEAHIDPSSEVTSTKRSWRSIRWPNAVAVHAVVVHAGAVHEAAAPAIDSSNAMMRIV